MHGRPHADTEDLFEYIRTNFSSFVKGPTTKLEGYDVGELKKWHSSNPNSAIMRFKGYVNGRNIDDADVMTNDYTKSKDYSWWMFRPVSDLNILNPIGGDKNHPLAGNREFGMQKNGSNYIFYIQGIDRLWSVLDEVAVGAVNDGYFFKITDNLWRQVMRNITQKINQMGGQANFNENEVISKRINYHWDVFGNDEKKIKKAGN